MAVPYRMPAEWEPQQAIWLAWPHEKKDWPGKFGTIPWVYCEIIRLIAETQRVHLLVDTTVKHDKALRMLEQVHANLDHVTIHIQPTDRVWLRDSGGIYVRGDAGKMALLDWQFNAWAKYDNYALDQQVAGFMASVDNLTHIKPLHDGRRITLEGGAIDVNGNGLMLTTKECLLSEDIQVRNPGFTQRAYEAIAADYLGADEVIWLNRGICGDDTHGHVDDISRFVAEHRVVTAVESDMADDNYALLRENEAVLRTFRSKAGKALEVVTLPMPKPLYFDGHRLPASYANFLICNDIVLVPTFNDANDRTALSILGECFPTRNVMGVHAVDLVWGFGTLHCLSQQQPRA